MPAISTYLKVNVYMHTNTHMHMHGGWRWGVLFCFPTLRPCLCGDDSCSLAFHHNACRLRGLFVTVAFAVLLLSVCMFGNCILNLPLRCLFFFPLPMDIPSGHLYLRCLVFYNGFLRWLPGFQLEGAAKLRSSL